MKKLLFPLLTALAACSGTPNQNVLNAPECERLQVQGEVPHYCDWDYDGVLDYQDENICEPSYLDPEGVPDSVPDCGT